MQSGIIQLTGALVLPVDSSVTVPFPCGSVIGVSSGKAVYPDAAGADLIGIATADQDTDENTIDIFVKVLVGGGTAGGNSTVGNLVLGVKVTTGTFTAFADAWLDGTNGGISPTKPGTTPVWIGKSLEAGGVGEMIKCLV